MATKRENTTKAPQAAALTAARQEALRLQAEAQAALEAAREAQAHLASLQEQEEASYQERLEALTQDLLKTFITAERAQALPLEAPLNFGDAIYQGYGEADARFLPAGPFATLQAGYQRKGYWERQERIDHINKSYRQDEHLILSLYIPRHEAADLLRAHGLLAEEEA